MPAVQRKEDSILLPQIDGEDLVALDFQYHHKCYNE